MIPMPLYDGGPDMGTRPDGQTATAGTIQAAVAAAKAL